MSDARLSDLERLFQAAADLAPDDRAAFIAALPPADRELVPRLEAMLRRLETGSLGGPFLDLGSADHVLEGPGTGIGRYKLLQRIGEGGFGVVYMAEQKEPVVRRVALKIIKLGMDTQEVVARFEAERQALALMDHPSIAQVFDGGATSTGRPYFVMELVRGQPITEFADENGLTTAERLDLFTRVCHAVQHAHGKGIIHRDIKPSNVLVTMVDGRPMPKVIDFGIAKAIEGPLTDRSYFTDFRHFIGTPAYMSPEQAGMSSQDIDTRSDVYSLGVLLYELLAGSTPLDSAELARAGLEEIKRRIREEEPPRPSQRVSTSADRRVSMRRGGFEPRALARALDGDLDWIVMKALDKDRSRRYVTASEFAADVERHRRGEAVEAGPPGAAYRLRKFVRRHRLAVGLTAFFVLVVATAFELVIAAFLDASRARDLADQRQVEANRARDDESRQRGLAEDEVRRQERVFGFLSSTLALADPAVSLEPDFPVRRLIERATLRIEGAFADDAESEARIRRTIGMAWWSMGELEPAEVELRRALALHDQASAAGRPCFAELDAYSLLWTLTNALFRLDRRDAFELAQRALAAGRESFRHDHPELADAMGRFMNGAEEAAHGPDPEPFQRVLPVFEEVRRLAEAELGADDPRWPAVADNFMGGGFTLWYSPHEAGTAPFFAAAHAIRERVLPRSHPDVGEALAQWVGVLNRSGRAAEAEPLIRDSLARLREVFDGEHRQVVFAEAMLGECLLEQGRIAEAEPLVRRSHAILSRHRRAEDFQVADSMARMLRLASAKGDQETGREVRAQLAEACIAQKYLINWPITRLVFGPEFGTIQEGLDQLVGRIGINYGLTEGSVRPDAELERGCAGVLAAGKALLAVDRPESAILGRVLLRLLDGIDRGPGGALRRTLAQASADLLQPFEARIPLDRAEALAQVALSRWDAGDVEGALTEARALLQPLAGLEAGDAWLTAAAKVRIARALLAVRLFEETEKLLLPAARAIRRQLGATNLESKLASDLVVALYEAWGRPDRAAEWR